MYLLFTRMPGQSYRRRLRSLLLCLCYVFRALINSLVCVFQYLTEETIWGEQFLLLNFAVVVVLEEPALCLSCTSPSYMHMFYQVFVMGYEV